MAQDRLEYRRVCCCSPPAQRALSPACEGQEGLVDNSPSSRSSVAPRILGVKLAIAADRIRRRSPCKKAVSGPTRESGIFNRSAVPLFPPKSSIGTSRRPRPRLSRTPGGASSRTACCGPRLIRSFMNNHIFPCDWDSFLLNKLPRRENVRETDSAQ